MPIGKEATTKVSQLSVALSVGFEDQQLKLSLSDGRAFLLPLHLYPSLLKADRKTRAKWEIIGNGLGFHWPDLDLDLATDQLVHGVPEAIPSPPDLNVEPKKLSSNSHRVRMKDWVLDAIKGFGGSASIVDVSRAVWAQHERDIRESDDLFYKWQYEIRWAADLLRKNGQIVSGNGHWRLSDKVT